MDTTLSETLVLAPGIWPGPGSALDPQPGDLTKFVPGGLGLGAPMVMMPWDSVGDLPRRGNYYGFDTPSIHPFHNAPTNDSSGGMIYFDNGPRREDFDAALGLLGVGGRSNEFLAFWRRSENPLEDRYIEQLRLMPAYALSLFSTRLTEETSPLAQQKMTLREAIWAFVENQQPLYGRETYPWELSGILGGDGDWAKESLAFGFMVENGYHQIYRIWSRAWLVTK